MTCCELIRFLYVNTGKTFWISGYFFWTGFFPAPLALFPRPHLAVWLSRMLVVGNWEGAEQWEKCEKL